MTVELPQPLGFPLCARCPYLVNGTPRICGDCAGQTLDPIPDDHCPVCSQITVAGARCRNFLCGWPEGTARRQRAITRIDAVAQYTDPFSSYLRQFKEQPGAAGWARIFGRLLVGWMEKHPEMVEDIDLIVGNPTFTGRQPLQHIEAIMAAAYVEDINARWPFPAPGMPVLIKPTATTPSKDRDFAGKEAAAWEHYEALSRNPNRNDEFAGKRILLIDDICTTGLQLNYLASGFKQHGAADVRGLVLARVPWKF